MKKIFIIILTFLTVQTAYAEAPEISAECAYVCELESGIMLYGKNENMQHAMASTTKIMTAIIALEKCSPNEAVEVSINAANTEGSSIYIEAGEQIKMKDLVYGLMLNSGNDAAVAIAEHISGDTQAFCIEMNNKAKEIGAFNTNFKNPNGLFDDEHYTTASDLAIITRYAMKNEIFRQIVSTKNYSATLLNNNRILYFKNHNKLLWNFEGAIGVKTGYTKDTGRCLVSSAEKDGCTLIAVTLDAPNDWNDHQKLLDFGFSELEPRIVIENGQVMHSSKIGDRNYDFIAERDCTIYMKKGNSGATVSINMPNTFTAPINRGEKVGTITVTYGQSFSDTINIVSAEDIQIPKEKELSFFEKLIKLIKAIFA